MISFSNPIYIYTLFGLAIPIVIHLWNNKRAKSRMVGSVQFIVNASQARIKSISFHDIWLFILRVILFLLLTLLLLSPQIKVKLEEKTQEWILLDPTLNKDVVEQYSNKNNTRWLHYDFPSILLEKPNIPKNYWSVLKTLSKHPAKKATVITHQDINTLSGDIPKLTADIEWIRVPRQAFIQIAGAKHQADSLFVTYRISDKNNTRYDRQSYFAAEKTIPLRYGTLSISLGKSPESWNLQLNSGKTYVVKKTLSKNLVLQGENDLFYIESALNAINFLVDNTFNIIMKKDVKDQQYIDWLICLEQDHKTHSHLLSENTIYYELHDTLNQSSFFVETINGFTIVKSPNPNQTNRVLDDSFVDELFSVLHQEKEELFGSIEIPDVQKSRFDWDVTIYNNLKDYIWILLLLTTLVERFIVYRRYYVA